ncbi:MAG: PH domain-containing protein [Pyrinomonadaceae bacterium]|nr:PH domain-containing protein [Phycisphaerales bacterium]
MSGTSSTERAAAWVYSGVWAILASWFKVPADPPVLPASDGEVARSFKPDRAFLRYRKLYFWLGLVAFDALLTLGWFAIWVSSPIVGLVLFVPYLIVAIVPDILVYIAIHLQYDTTWYVMNSRSLRIRRGVWIIQETTVTFENVQNVDIRQGPVQRCFGIASLVVHTAGGGGGGEHAKAGLQGGHIALLEGIGDARAIRDLIMHNAAVSRSAGLGDDPASNTTRRDRDAGVWIWTPAHKAILREIRDVARSAASVS